MARTWLFIRRSVKLILDTLFPRTNLFEGMKLVVVLGIFLVLLLEVDGGFFKDKAPTVPPAPPAPPKTAAEECLLLKPASQQCSCQVFFGPLLPIQLFFSAVKQSGCSAFIESVRCAMKAASSIIATLTNKLTCTSSPP